MVSTTRPFRWLLGRILICLTMAALVVGVETRAAAQDVTPRSIAETFLSGRQRGQALVRLVYVLKSDKLATVWEFYFYKPQASWFLANLNFNDQFNGLR